MGRVVCFLIILSFPFVAWAGVPRDIPPIDNVWLQKFLSSLRKHHNVLERLTVDPKGIVNAMPGYHVEATFDNLSHVCTATGLGPLTTTTWSCTAGQSLP